MRRALLAIVLAVSAAGFTLSADDEYTAAARRRFKPDKPAACMDYSVTYRLLGLELKQLADATVTAEEGFWPGLDGAFRPACLVEFVLSTGGAGAEDQRGMVQIYNRITAVLTMPDLNAVLFIKRSKQRISLLCKRKFLDNLEVYNTETGALDYVCHDYLSNTVSTNLVGAEDLTRQGREVSRFLKVLHANYHNYLAQDDLDPETPVYIYTEGDLVPFRLDFGRERDVVPVLGSEIPAMYFAARPHRDAQGRGRNFDMWAASFLDVSLKSEQPDLVSLARSSLPWSMVPLRTDLGLPLGAIRCFLTGIRALPLPGKAPPGLQAGAPSPGGV
ncbi:MAG: hypothetical protein ACOYCD_08330 [Kiritimatiellia bacterium]